MSSLCAPFGETKYAQDTKAFSSLCISTLWISVFERAARIHLGVGFFGSKRLNVVRLDCDVRLRMLSVLMPKRHMSALISLSIFFSIKSLILG